MQFFFFLLTTLILRWYITDTQVVISPSTVLTMMLFTLEFFSGPGAPCRKLHVVINAQLVRLPHGRDSPLVGDHEDATVNTGQIKRVATVKAGKSKHLGIPLHSTPAAA